MQVNENIHLESDLQKCSFIDFSGVHVLLVGLFGIPIVRSISHLFGRPKKNLVNQKNVWYAKKNFAYQKKIWSTKKMWNWPDNWYTKETDQKYMDATQMFGWILYLCFNIVKACKVQTTNEPLLSMTAGPTGRPPCLLIRRRHLYQARRRHLYQAPRPV